MSAGNEVFLNAEVLEYPPALKYLRDAALDDVIRHQPVEPLAVEFHAALRHLAALGAQQPRDCLEGRRLAGAVGAEEGGDLPLLGVQRDALEHQDDAIVNDFDVVERQHARLDPFICFMDATRRLRRRAPAKAVRSASADG